MSKTRFTPWVVLACIGTLAGCTSGEDGTVGNTELNVVLPNGCEQDSSAPDCFDIQVVEYTIACDDGDDTPNGPFLDNAAGFDDRVVISGVLEVFDTPQPGRQGRATSGDPWTWGKDLGAIYVAQGFMDLPVTQRCSAQLRARTAPTRENPLGEVVCTDTVTFDVEADKVSTVNVLMVCGLSFQAPVAQLDLAADFSFNVSNFCPDAFVLNCIDTDIDVRQIPGLGALAVTACQTRFRDGDLQCGNSCDPQVCNTAPEGLRCEPQCLNDTAAFPDGCPTEPTTTVTCNGGAAAAAIDCNGFPNFDPDTGLPLPPDTECVFTGDTLGEIGGPAPGPPPALGGTGPGPGGFFVTCAICDASYIFLTQGQDARCTVPTGLPVTPGAEVKCTAVTTDGDTDCDKTKTVSLICPGLTPCEAFGGDAACDDANECTVNTCNDATGAPVCETDNTANDGNSCTPSAPGAGMCNGGACEGTSCAAQCDPQVDPENCDAVCDNDGNDCTFAPAGTCDLGTGNCSALTDRPNTFACDSGAGTSGDGTCDGAGTCESNDLCTTATEAADCEVNTNECLLNRCNVTGAPWVCETVNNGGADCNCDVNGENCLGVCDDAGACVEPPFIDDGSGDTAWRAQPILCEIGTFRDIDLPRSDCADCLENSCSGGTNNTRACGALCEENCTECPGGKCIPATPGPADCSLDCFTFFCDALVTTCADDNTAFCGVDQDCVDQGLTGPCNNTSPTPGGGSAVYPTAVEFVSVNGCEVVSNTLKNQLATDTNVFLNATSNEATRELTLTYSVIAANAGLALAGPLAQLADVTVDTILTSASPGFLTNKLAVALQGSEVSDYITAGEFRLNPTQLLPITAVVTPTSFPTMAANFDPAAILIELVIKSSGAPLDITGDACTFTNEEATCFGGANNLEVCDPSVLPGGGPNGANCAQFDPQANPQIGICVRTNAADITLNTTNPNVP